jgi:hypothetical protein
MTPRTSLSVVFLAIVLVACADTKQKPAKTRDQMTQREKDSVLGESGLPGAQGVTKALKMSDSVAAIRKRQDSLLNKPDTSGT